MSDTATLRLGLWQAAGQAGNIAANMAEIARVVRDAAGQTDLIIFPEGFLTGYYTPDAVEPIARQVTPGVLGDLAALSAETGIALIVGSYQPLTGAVANSALIFTPDGGHIGSYQKRLLFGRWEKRVFHAGTQPFLFNYKGFRVGVLICYDIEFPECTRELARNGADLIAVPTAVMAPFDTVPTITVPARAIENQCFVAYANRIGRDAVNTYLGQSRIVGPLGECLAAPDATERLITATLDLSARTNARRSFDYLADLDAAQANPA